MSRAELEEVVATSDKQRFAFDDSNTLIRANQGHSVAVDLELEPVAPPPVLYHGTGAGSVDAILRAGLVAMGRHHVHLSPDVQTAQRVGRRHGRPVVLVIDAASMAADGHAFFRSQNGVWLTSHVPAALSREGDVVPGGGASVHDRLSGLSDAALLDVCASGGCAAESHELGSGVDDEALRASVTVRAAAEGPVGGAVVDLADAPQRG